MKKTTTAVLLLASFCFAQAGEETPTFNDKEWNVSIFGIGEFGRDNISTKEYPIGRKHKTIQLENTFADDNFGVGIGSQKFFTTFTGLQAGLDVSAWLTDVTHVQGSFVDNARGGAVLRYPINDSGIAPFIGAGIGYDFEDADHLYQYAEVGIELRTGKNWSIFASGGYNWSFIGDQDVDSYPSARAGFRFWR